MGSNGVGAAEVGAGPSYTASMAAPGSAPQGKVGDAAVHVADRRNYAQQFCKKHMKEIRGADYNNESKRLVCFEISRLILGGVEKYRKWGFPRAFPCKGTSVKASFSPKTFKTAKIQKNAPDLFLGAIYF